MTTSTIRNLLLISLTCLFLGGCTILPNNQAASDQKPTSTENSVGTDNIRPKTSSAPEGDDVVTPSAVPLSSDSDEDSLENDLSNTQIDSEDFSDLQ